MSILKPLHLAKRGFFNYSIGKLFYQEKLNKDGKLVPPKRFFSSLNQKLMEAGYTPPWIMTREECQSFWKSMENTEKYTGNRPLDYARKSTGIIDFLHEFWRPKLLPAIVFWNWDVIVVQILMDFTT